MIDPEMPNKLSRSVASQGENVVGRAILLHTGDEEISLVDVARLGRVARFPDGSMVFSYGGVDLIRLWPVQVATKVENGSTVLTATRQYEMLI